MQDITDNYWIGLSLKQLKYEREKIITFNKKLSDLGYKFKGVFEAKYPKYLDELIRVKEVGYQLRLF